MKPNEWDATYLCSLAYAIACRTSVRQQKHPDWDDLLTWLSQVAAQWPTDVMAGACVIAEDDAGIAPEDCGVMFAFVPESPLAKCTKMLTQAISVFLCGQNLQYGSQPTDTDRPVIHQDPEFEAKRAFCVATGMMMLGCHPEWDRANILLHDLTAMAIYMPPQLMAKAILLVEVICYVPRENSLRIELEGPLKSKADALMAAIDALRARADAAANEEDNNVVH
jgi:hypothetical protein